MSVPDPDHPRAALFAVVLAGGRSSRMGGSDKTRLDIGGESALWRVVTAAPAELCVVVGSADRQDLPEDVRFVREDPPLSGPVAALERGVREVRRLVDQGERPGETRIPGLERRLPAQEGRNPAAARDGVDVLVLGGDMPRLTRRRLEQLVAADPGRRRVRMMVAAQRREFLCAVWPLSRLEDALDALSPHGRGWADLSLRRLYAQLDADELVNFAADGEETADIDTPQDLTRAREALAGGGGPARCDRADDGTGRADDANR